MQAVAVSGSEIRDPEKSYSGSRIQGAKRPRIRIRNTAGSIRIRIQIKIFYAKLKIIYNLKICMHKLALQT
jgi:hypothetical protein